MVYGPGRVPNDGLLSQGNPFVDCATSGVLNLPLFRYLNIQLQALLVYARVDISLQAVICDRNVLNETVNIECLLITRLSSDWFRESLLFNQNTTIKIIDDLLPVLFSRRPLLSLGICRTFGDGGTMGVAILHPVV